MDHVELLFDAGLTVITGETGAGKSIILGAMDLILGERSSADILWEPTKKCVVEATFNVTDIVSPAFFAENEIDYEPETIIRREIAPVGKSRAFINDSPVNLNILRTLTRQLVDIHRPHQTLDLADSRFQTDMLDALCEHGDLLSAYRINWKRYNNLSHEINTLEKQQQDLLKEQDFLQFQYNELEQAKLEKGELEQLETEFRQLEHAVEIKAQLASVYALLNNEEFNVLLHIKEAERQLQNISKLAPAAADLFNRMQTAVLELEDIAAETERLNDTIQADPERRLLLQERLDILYRLQKKHHTGTIEGLVELKENLQSQLGTLAYKSEHLDTLRNEKAQLEIELRRQGTRLSVSRCATAGVFEEKVNAMLPDVGMPQARLQITVIVNKTFGYNGFDNIEFLFTANKGGSLKPIEDVASVGEMSRLMLCIKSVVGTHTQLPTMFFDEIDTGISGQTAITVAQLLKALAGTQQIITITHLPQIAAKGQSHYFVFKEEDALRTYTRVRQLTASERVPAIAQMLSGNRPTEAALKNAKELLA